MNVLRMFIAFVPRVAHVAEYDEEHEAPEPWERHVKDDKMLPGLDGRHLFKEPEMCPEI